jgi:hypothetical protein
MYRGEGLIGGGFGTIESLLSRRKYKPGLGLDRFLRIAILENPEGLGAVEVDELMVRTGPGFAVTLQEPEGILGTVRSRSQSTCLTNGDPFHFIQGRREVPPPV